jgi:hypothetical protein
MAELAMEDLTMKDGTHDEAMAELFKEDAAVPLVPTAS